MKRVLVAVGLALCAVASASAQTPSMTAHFIDIGQGESVLLEFSCGAMLIDAGAQDAAARTSLIAYLNKFFARRTDLHKTINTVLITTITSTTISRSGRSLRTSPSITTSITRAAAATFIERYYRQSYSRMARRPPPPDMRVPSDYADRLLRVRRTLRLTQGQFAESIGAANKAVVYQWESKKRTPSPVFWQKIAALEKTSIAARRHVLA